MMWNSSSAATSVNYILNDIVIKKSINEIKISANEKDFVKNIKTKLL